MYSYLKILWISKIADVFICYVTNEISVIRATDNKANIINMSNDRNRSPKLTDHYLACIHFKSSFIHNTIGVIEDEVVAKSVSLFLSIR